MELNQIFIVGVVTFIALCAVWFNFMGNNSKVSTTFFNGWASGAVRHMKEVAAIITSISLQKPDSDDDFDIKEYNCNKTLYHYRAALRHVTVRIIEVCRVVAQHSLQQNVQMLPSSIAASCEVLTKSIDKLHNQWQGINQPSPLEEGATLLSGLDMGMVVLAAEANQAAVCLATPAQPKATQTALEACGCLLNFIAQEPKLGPSQAKALASSIIAAANDAAALLKLSERLAGGLVKESADWEGTRVGLQMVAKQSAKLHDGMRALAEQTSVFPKTLPDPNPMAPLKDQPAVSSFPLDRIGALAEGVVASKAVLLASPALWKSYLETCELLSTSAEEHPLPIPAKYLSDAQTVLNGCLKGEPPFTHKPSKKINETVLVLVDPPTPLREQIKSGHCLSDVAAWEAAVGSDLPLVLEDLSALEGRKAKHAVVFRAAVGAFEEVKDLKNHTGGLIVLPGAKKPCLPTCTVTELPEGEEEGNQKYAFWAASGAIYPQFLVEL